MISSLTLIAVALQRELFERGVKFLTVDDCQEILRVSIDKALRAGAHVHGPGRARQQGPDVAIEAASIEAGRKEKR